MDKTIAGLLGAVGALVASAPGHSSPLPAQHGVLQANSYSELLRPVPNARETLQAMDAEAVDEPAQVELAQYFHDHHHHRRYFRRRHRHHHHHHHHHHRDGF